MKVHKTGKKMEKKVKPTDLKAKVKEVLTSSNYNWETQSQMDVAKSGTYGTTSQYSPGRIISDMDSYTD